MPFLPLKKLLLALIVAMSSMTLSASSSTVMQKAQRTDGFLDFLAALAGQSVEDALPVERVSNVSGQVATAHMWREPDGFRVSGLVRKTWFVGPPPWAHVDVLLLDARHRVIESVATRYLPRDIPSGRRGAFPQSRYAARLRTANPPQGATVRVVFDGRPESQCPLIRIR